MFGSEILEIVIGLSFVFLLLSLICSAAAELIEAWLKMRASDLEQGIREVLNDPKGLTLAKQLYDHPLVYSLFKGNYDPEAIKDGRYPSGSDLPSYIPSRNFALALMDIILPANPAPSKGEAILSDASGTLPSSPNAAKPLQPFREAIAKIENPKVERALMTLVDEAGDDISKTRQNIEDWYNSSMDRVTGWYKRRTQAILLLVGLIVAVAVNADTLAIGGSLSQNRALRDSVVAAAQEQAKGQAQASNSTVGERLKKNLDDVQAVGLPLGWNKDDPRSMPGGWEGYLMKVFGWILTALAISLGAPFWFHILNQFLVVRSTIKSS